MEKKNDKNGLIKQLDTMGIDIPFLIQESFLGYKYRKYSGLLYESDASIPTKLIKMYYEVRPDDAQFDEMKKSFISRYILNESKIEGINDTSIHGQSEIDGLRAMYEYIHSDDIDYMFNIYTLKELHEKLYSCCDYPAFGGTFRNWDVYLPGTGTELSEWSMIRPRLNELDEKVAVLKEYAEVVKKSKDADMLLDYLDKCVELNCDIIKVHPFGDGNGRTVRGFTNKLMEDAGLPPIYIKTNERTEYHNAMNKANNEGDYSDIKSFYKYKVCDSITELDFTSQVREEYNALKDETKVKVKTND